MRLQLQSLAVLPLRTSSKCPLNKTLGGTPNQSTIMMRKTDEDYGLMGYAIQFDSWLPMFQKNLLILSSPSNVHKCSNVEAAGSFNTSVPVY